MHVAGNARVIYHNILGDTYEPQVSVPPSEMRNHDVCPLASLLHTVTHQYPIHLQLSDTCICLFETPYSGSSESNQGETYANPVVNITIMYSSSVSLVYARITATPRRPFWLLSRPATDTAGDINFEFLE